MTKNILFFIFILIYTSNIVYAFGNIYLPLDGNTTDRYNNINPIGFNITYVDGWINEAANFTNDDNFYYNSSINLTYINFTTDSICINFWAKFDSDYQGNNYILYSPYGMFNYAYPIGIWFQYSDEYNTFFNYQTDGSIGWIYSDYIYGGFTVHSNWQMFTIDINMTSIIDSSFNVENDSCNIYKLYVNDSLINMSGCLSADLPFLYDGSNVNSYIGYYPNLGGLNGLIDEYKIFNYSCTQDIVTEIYETENQHISYLNFTENNENQITCYDSLILDTVNNIWSVLEMIAYMMFLLFCFAFGYYVATNGNYYYGISWIIVGSILLIGIRDYLSETSGIPSLGILVIALVFAMGTGLYFLRNSSKNTIIVKR